MHGRKNIKVYTFIYYLYLLRIYRLAFLLTFHISEDKERHFSYFVSTTLKQCTFSELRVLMSDNMEKKNRKQNFEQPR